MFSKTSKHTESRQYGTAHCRAAKDLDLLPSTKCESGSVAIMKLLSFWSLLWQWLQTMSCTDR